MSRAAASEAKSSRPIGPPHHKTILNTFLLHRARRIFFLKENGGRILPPKAAFRGQSPLCFPKKHKKICSRPMVLGRERTYASWCHPNSGRTASPLASDGAGREPRAFLPPLIRCPSSSSAGSLSAPRPSLWADGWSTAAESLRYSIRNARSGDGTVRSGIVHITPIQIASGQTHN